MQIVPYDGEPCLQCGSTRHGTPAHGKLESAYRQWGFGLIGWEPPVAWTPDGAPGPLSHSTNDLDPPDHLRIVPFTISGPGMDKPFRSAGILRLWKEDPEEGFTFTLSWETTPDAPVDFLARLFGEVGSAVTVEIGSKPSIPAAVLPGTSRSI